MAQDNVSDNISLPKHTITHASLTLEPTNEDDRKLNDLGIKKSALQRNFDIWSLLFVSFCTTVTWEAISAASAQALTSGGSSSFVWGFAIAALGAFGVALCIAEYSSMIPTAGGQYHYVAELAAPKYCRILSWYTGWITIIGWFLSATTGILSTALQFQAWAILFSPNYAYKRWHTSMIAIGLTGCYTLFAIFEIRHLHRLIFVAMFCHVFGYLATPIYLLVHVDHKNSAEYVFTDTTNLSGWKSPGVAWSLGLLSSAIGFVGWDSSVHLAEEMVDAARNLPRTMVFNVSVSALLTFPWVIAVAFCMTDIGGILSGPVATISPFAQLFYNVSGGSQAATIGLTCILPVIGFCGTGAAIISATSRVVWSFARDKGLPERLSIVDTRHKVPTSSLVLTALIISTLCLTYIGNATAFYGIASACTVSLMLSYAFPLFVVSICGFQHCSVPRGAFTLGRLHRPLAIVSSAWCLYLVAFLCIPTLRPITATNMNYAAVFIILWLVVATATWTIYGRRTYIGLTQRLEGARPETSTPFMEN